MGSPRVASWKRYLSELGGTFALAFFGPATIVTMYLVPGLDATSRLFFDALVPGVTLAFCITFLAKYSGSHVNPAISVTFASAGDFRWRMVPSYVVAQLVGGILGGLALWSIFGSVVPEAHLGSNQLGTGVSPAEGITLEVLGTIILCLVVHWSVALVKGVAKQGAIIGATLTVLIFNLGPVSGGSFNPFRSLGPALFAGYVDSQYVYVIGPIAGAAIAGLLFKSVRGQKRGAT